MTALSSPARVLDSSAAGDVRGRVRAAMERGTRCRIVGGATWLDAGRPVEADESIELGPHSGIIEYVPGDLTLTALAGTTLAELDRVTAAERQWLPLDPFGSDAGTLGATVATASAGPLSHGFGLVRDNVLGVEVVTGRGEIVRAGGRVVKNVAGFDLTRLMIGAWGTLGVLTEVTVRLRARPEMDRTLVARLPDDPEGLERLLSAIRRSAFSPLALQLVNGALARRLGLGDAPCVLARVGGNEESVRAQRGMLAHALESSESGSSGEASHGAAAFPLAEAPATVWRALRQCEPADALVLRLAAPATALAYLWTGALEAAAAVDGTLVHAWCGSGTVRLVVPIRSLDADDFATLALVRTLPESRRIGERLARPLWASLTPGAIEDELSRRMRGAFDPHLLLNPGIFGETP